MLASVRILICTNRLLSNWAWLLFLIFDRVVVFFVLISLSNQIVDIIKNYFCLWVFALKHSTHALALTQFFELVNDL